MTPRCLYPIVAPAHGTSATTLSRLFAARRGHSRSPIEVHKGNTGDLTALAPAVERVKERFRIEHVVFVEDYGMITEHPTRPLAALDTAIVNPRKMRRVRTSPMRPY